MGRTFSDWQEPVRLLEGGTGAPTDAQRSLVEKLGLIVNGHEPRDVLGVMLEEHLRPIIWGTSTEPASERQLAFLDSLRGSNARSGLSKPLASAWIDHYLALRNTDKLRSLRLQRGDTVVRRFRWRHPADHQLHETEELYVVSSIGPAGLVYFKGGNGKCGWASSLEQVPPAGNHDDYPRYTALPAAGHRFERATFEG